MKTKQVTISNNELKQMKKEEYLKGYVKGWNNCVAEVNQEFYVKKIKLIRCVKTNTQIGNL